MFVVCLCVTSGAGGAGGSERRSLTVSEARDILEDVEAEAMLPPELLAKEAVRELPGTAVTLHTPASKL